VIDVLAQRLPPIFPFPLPRLRMGR
jgi:hypothetical protein